MSTFPLLFCAIILSLSINYGSTVSKFRFSNDQKDCYDNNSEPNEMIKRLRLVKDMTREAWQQHRDISNKTEKDLRVIQMLSTLWVMELKEEFECGKKWVEQNYNSSDDLDALKVTFVASTEYMGSLLSCYALTNDTTWLDRAKLVGKSLEVEFDTLTGLPKNHLTLPGTSYSWFKAFFFDDRTVHLAEAGGQHLEFSYLADMTNDFDMKAKVYNARTFLRNVQTANGLYMDEIYISSGKWKGNTSTLNWPASTFYQYLIKSFVQSNGQDEQAIEMYREAIDAMVNHSSMIRKSKEDGLTYVFEPPFDGKYMDYSSCYLGAMLALGANAMEQQLDSRSPSTGSNVNNQQQTRIDQHWTLAKAITETCHRHANRSRTELPSRYYFGFRDGFTTFETIAAYAESYFVLWRLTHQTKYRYYAWELAQAIHKHCRKQEGEYYPLRDVEEEYSTSRYRDPMRFFSATLKYLYLTFSEDTLLPLDQWVFNRVGQPLPIRGKNPAYPQENNQIKV